ncbi:mutator mutT protein [Desulfuromusa kysingii]|uniref:Mutator mutT protein n=1 Tax=Desulfuromusa kysingii TaxID=37625 RepID=A0A1H3VX24_9BACT|nr:NUDIX hydrolase [Desulfuromusa kysingii]SDZ79290.1 mutator mutT protein [Desulfuromusa kysingii]
MGQALQRQIKTSVVACIMDDKDRILLTRRNIPPFFGQWVMPGGKIDHGESIESALLREVEEEVGLKVKIDKLVDIYEHLAIGNKKDHYIILYYRAIALSSELKLNYSELSEAVWFSDHQLPDLNVPPGCRQVLARLFPKLTWADLEHPGEDADNEIPNITALR